MEQECWECSLGILTSGRCGRMQAVVGVCACDYVCVRACCHAAGRSSKASKPCHSKAWTAAGSCERASAACFQRHLLATRGKWRGAAGRHAGPGPCSALRSAVGAPAPHFLTHTICAVPRICKQLLVFSSSETRPQASIGRRVLYAGRSKPKSPSSCCVETPYGRLSKRKSNLPN